MRRTARMRQRRPLPYSETSINALREKSTNLDASALRLQMLVEGMLEMVKLDKQVFTFAPTNLNLLVEQAVNLQRFLRRIRAFA